ncbi:MAG: glutaredoxin family protein [Burkholderiaceae bacterium]|jgi:glutaredoxin|nr:glutaredoxin family protein [Burkholderiaceae bacterium]
MFLHPHRRPHLPRVSASSAALLAFLIATAAQAQIYRATGPDGSTVFTDQPVPAAATTGAPRTATSGANASTTSGSALPYALAQIAQRYPVTLYTSDDCVPCTSGRNLLSNRGIPFTEKTVTTNNDIAAFTRLTGNNQLPALTIGGQRLNGYNDAEWSQYLDAAGYPKTSQLPASYRRPPPAPLAPAPATPVAPQPATTSNNADAPPPATGAPVAPQRVTPDNPAGILF